MRADLGVEAQVISLGWGSITAPCLVGGRRFVATSDLRRAGMKTVDTIVSAGIHRSTAKATSVHGRPTHGDSGGSLVALDAPGVPMQIGVDRDRPGLYGGSISYYNRI